MSVRDLRKVNIYFEKDMSSYIVSKLNLEKFISATKELHFEPGINPHNKEKTSSARKITVQKLEKTGPYWWSTPGLMDNNDSNGVSIFSWSVERIVWELPSGKEIKNKK